MTSCYQEFPITYQNQRGFLKPKTRVIVNTGTEIVCNTITPTLFQFGETWVELSPEIRITQAPKQLSSDYKTTWQSSSIFNLFKAGLYTNTQLEKYRDRIMFLMQQSAIQNSIDNTLTGRAVDNNYLNLKLLLRKDTLDHL